MAASLVQQGTLVGCTRSEVIVRLGEPDSTDIAQPQLLFYDLRLRYRSLDIDPVGGTYLIVNVGQDGLVSALQIQDWS
jgi:hypothetical protein